MKSHINLLYDPVIWLLCIYPRNESICLSCFVYESSQHHDEQCQKLKTILMSFNWRRNKMCNIHTKEYYSAMKSNELRIHSIIRMNLIKITTNERNQTQKTTYSMILSMLYFQKKENLWRKWTICYLEAVVRSRINYNWMQTNFLE